MQLGYPYLYKLGHMSNSNTSSLTADDIQAITQGFHDDPFSTFGPHQHDNQWVIRTFQPHATAVHLVHNGASQKMNQIDPHGLFELWLPELNTAAYHYKITTHQNETQIVEDPYRFNYSTAEQDLIVYEKQGAHRAVVEGIHGTHFSVWAPNAVRVSVVGTFNDWDGRRHVMRKHHESGIWGRAMILMSRLQIICVLLWMGILSYLVSLLIKGGIQQLMFQ